MSKNAIVLFDALLHVAGESAEGKAFDCIVAYPANGVRTYKAVPAALRNRMQDLGFKWQKSCKDRETGEWKQWGYFYREFNKRLFAQMAPTAVVYSSRKRKSATYEVKVADVKVAEESKAAEKAEPEVDAAKIAAIREALKVFTPAELEALKALL